MKYCVIANPHARNGRARAKIGALAAELSRSGLQHDLKLCESMDHAEALSIEAHQNGCDAIVAVGGDGTINRVMSGFFERDGRLRSDKPLGVVHVGTSPDFCLSYGIPADVPRAAVVLRSRRTRRIRVGRVDWLQDRAAGHFACCANAGLGATLARLANGGVRRYAGDKAGTFLSLVRALTTFRPRTLELTLDSQPHTLPRVYDLAVGRTSHIASGIKVRHCLTEQDDRFYIVCLHHLTWLRLPAVLRALYRPLPGSPASAELRRPLWQTYARKIELRSCVPTEVEFDGDPAGMCPCVISVEQQTINLIC